MAFKFDLTAENAAGSWEAEANKFAADGLEIDFTDAEIMDARDICGIDASERDVLETAAANVSSRSFFKQHPVASDSICFSAKLID